MASEPRTPGTPPGPRAGCLGWRGAHSSTDTEHDTHTLNSQHKAFSAAPSAQYALTTLQSPSAGRAHTLTPTARPGAPAHGRPSPLPAPASRGRAPPAMARARQYGPLMIRETARPPAEPTAMSERCARRSPPSESRAIRERSVPCTMRKALITEKRSVWCSAPWAAVDRVVPARHQMTEWAGRARCRR